MTYSRNCPQCQSEILYTIEHNCKRADLKKSICRSCSHKNKISKNPSLIKNMLAARGDISGANNPFYGKKHSEESISVLSKKAKERGNAPFMTPECQEKNKLKSLGEKNPMYGKTFYQVWVEKYGIEEADKRLVSYKKNKCESVPRGVEHHMYGKCPPNGTGNGWKGWYKDHYFRSLREAAFMIEMDEKLIPFKSAEHLSIPYNYNGSEKTYRPDFIAGDTVYEIKPLRLMKTSMVRAKTDAAEKFCKNLGLKFIITDIEVDFQKIKSLRDDGILKFDERYDERFDSYFK